MGRGTILYDRTNVPETSWPDGSPVSNWSKAVSELARISKPEPADKDNAATETLIAIDAAA